MSIKEKYPRLTKMPYYGTPVSAERTKVEIIALLEKYGIENHQWTKYEGKATIKFIIDTVSQGTKIKKAVQFDIPDIKALFGNKNQIVDVPEKQCLRIFYYSLKALLETTKYGIFQLDEILMSYTLTQLESGKYVQVKDLLKEHPLLLNKKNIAVLQEEMTQ